MCSASIARYAATPALTTYDNTEHVMLLDEKLLSARRWVRARAISGTQLEWDGLRSVTPAQLDFRVNANRRAASSIISAQFGRCNTHRCRRID